ncbi:porin [Defluviimonas sp. WL0002]|uniref:Porin n=1 Tax=Albidovulum marisflavi TaxID=2984159 RepID=A0ABT2Z7U4_9RHOB|nr:porin [Defluviimonas sp. WL0002]MCV2867207.1 porin [Defluviimonas sp. WL0002]
MKKVLLASTALFAFAGAAAAEVSLSGYAEIGVFGGDDVDTQFHNDIVINVNMSGSTDNGLEFGAKVQFDDTNGSSNINGWPRYDDEAVWVSGSFGKVTLGETDGAYDWALSEIYMGTSLFDDHSTHAGAYWFTGADGWYDNQVMRYEYSFGDFAAGISAEMDDTGTGDTIMAIGVKWSGNMGGVDLGVGLGYQSANSMDAVGLSLSAAMANGVNVTAGYADDEFWGGEWWGLGVGYTAGALLVQANYGEWDYGDSGWGLVANYDLGGGAVAMFGYGSSSSGSGGSFNGNGDDTWSAGLGLSF